MASGHVQPTSCVAVFERHPYWGPELKRQFPEPETLICECRSIQDMIPSVQGYTASLYFLVLDDNPADCLGWLGKRLSTDSSIPCLVAASAEFRELEWLIREAGGIYVDDETARTQIRLMCLRLLAKTT